MGNSVNPLAIRLYKVNTWSDIWIVKNALYPEVLHNILNIKSRLTDVFRSPFFERMVIY